MFNTKSPAINDIDFAFAENGLMANILGKQLPSQSFIKFVDEERYKNLVNFIQAPLRGRLGHPHEVACSHPFPCLVFTLIESTSSTFVEFRNGMINVSPIGRNATCASVTLNIIKKSLTRDLI